MNRRYFSRIIIVALVCGVGFGVFLTKRSEPQDADRPHAVIPPHAPSQAPSQEGEAATSSDLHIAPHPLAPETKVALLDQILASKNDNDPRLDRELRVLDDGAKELFRKKYLSLAPEKRNERGTVVFLLGRNLTQERDFQFICDVLRETPCLSLADCSRAKFVAKEDFHHESGEDVTLAYPQYVALSMLERYLQSSGQSRGHHDEAARNALSCGLDSRIDAVIKRTQALISSSG